jgi:hypothetical protein
MRFYLLHACCMPRPAYFFHLPSFDHLNNIWRRVQIMKLFCMRCNSVNKILHRQTMASVQFMLRLVERARKGVPKPVLNPGPIAS